MDIATVPGTGTLIGPDRHDRHSATEAVFALSRETALLDAHLAKDVTDSEVRNRGAIEHTSKETERTVHVGIAAMERSVAHARELQLEGERRIEERVRLEGEKTRDLLQTIRREDLQRENQELRTQVMILKTQVAGTNNPA